ncbi:helix-turn-helix domain-containing protein [Rhodococcus sp. D2-41]|uniref:Helix-turn-helix domain-containing protein n=1 Tax=Speluncibacter jeojiensis TaxID=2710754 RepID=A0A9X4RFJ2_9ACTN|nr:helix-turn-helix domain-containing protein [Rhodococcus sp. D2-41]MDG3009355.1 helix-turn-helix domain-containing protein [Rhodococcus sp. D2-41]MDG3017090.1 helix-turn-helix domain-containing protein [Corynebacteriales bacterium D3-21]
MSAQRPKKPTKAHELAPRVAELHAAGMSAYAIRRELGCAAGTVQRAAQVAGVTFARPPAAAIEAVVIDAAQRRDRLADRWFRAAGAALDNLDGALADGDHQAARAYAMVAGIGTDKLLTLTPAHDPESEGRTAALAALGELMGAIRASDD